MDSDNQDGSSSAHVLPYTPEKKPPLDRPEDVKNRRLVVFSFWAVVILLGLPVWWWTTSIYRALLPLDSMLDWADGRACKPVLPLRLTLYAPSLPRQETEKLIETTQRTLDALNDFHAHRLQLELGSGMPKEHEPVGQYGSLEGEIALGIQLVENKDSRIINADLRPHSNIMDVSYPKAQAQMIPSVLSSKLRDIFAEERAFIAYILNHQPKSSNDQQSLSGDGQSAQDAEANLASKFARRTTRALKYAPTYHITISLFTPTSAPSSWDIEAAVNEYLAPLLSSYTISNFTIDTQVQLYAGFAPSAKQPEFDAEKGAWTLRTEDLSGFVNAAEWPLSPSIGSGPTINFILYVPSEKMTPLLVKETNASSWLIPQWGGVNIHNAAKPNEPSPSHLTKETLQSALLIFSRQLLSLLGASDSPDSFPLQMQTLTRVQAVSLLQSASSTMGSLARLTKSLASIPIPKNVAVGVDKTLFHLRQGCTALGRGNFADVLRHSRVAEVEAEKVFFEKSMVGQVYFPDEHKVAVYLPLLGPIGVPLVTSLLKVIKQFRAAAAAR